MSCQLCKRTDYPSQQLSFLCFSLQSVCKSCLKNLKAGDKCPCDLGHLITANPLINNGDMEMDPTHTGQQLRNEPTKVQPKENNTKERDDHEQRNRCSCNELTQTHLKIIAVVYLVQFTFTVCNLYFPVNRPTQDCMDSGYGPGGTTLREWMLAIGITEMVLMGLGLLVIFCYKINLCEQSTFEVLSVILLALLAVKVVLWASIQFDLFRYGMAEFCTGGLFAYGVVMVTIHFLLLVVLGVFRFIH